MNPADFIAAFRLAAPYIHAHRGRTFVVQFGGEALLGPGFGPLVHDLALLASLGVRLVLVQGIRPQVEALLKQRGLAPQYHRGLRVTDAAALACVQQAAGAARVEMEARLSMGLANTPMAGARLRTAGGNLVIAKPLGVREGVDYQHTGEVRRVDADGIRQHLDAGSVVLLPPLGYSPTGEVFNLSAEEVATAAAAALRADKLLLLGEEPARAGRRPIPRQLTSDEAQALLDSGRTLAASLRGQLRAAVQAVRAGVQRVHLLERRAEGVLLRELFTRDGAGTLVAAEAFERIRAASLDDVGGLLELIAPLEAAGVLVRRPRELLEMEIGCFQVAERDGAIVACAALYPYAGEGAAELACLAVHPGERRRGLGEQMLAHCETLARAQGLRRLFVLTTQSAHWFLERGFEQAGPARLPGRRQALYNWQRGSRVLIKNI